MGSGRRRRSKAGVIERNSLELWEFPSRWRDLWDGWILWTAVRDPGEPRL